MREYAAVPSIRRYVILEPASVGLMHLERTAPGETWRSTVLTTGDILSMPDIGIEVPVTGLYEGVEFEHIDQPSA